MVVYVLIIILLILFLIIHFVAMHRIYKSADASGVMEKSTGFWLALAWLALFPVGLMLAPTLIAFKPSIGVRLKSVDFKRLSDDAQKFEPPKIEPVIAA